MPTSPPFRRRACFAATAALMLIHLPASASPRSVPIGGRTATMGGAGTAAGNDSAMPYINPAGMAGLPADVFAVSASVYSYGRLDISNYLAPNGFAGLLGPSQVDANVSARTLFELPSSVMYFHHLTDGDFRQVAGMSLVIPDVERREIVGSYLAKFPASSTTMSEQSSQTLQRTDYYFGPSYGFQLEEDLRVGVSLYALYVKHSATWQSLWVTDMGTAVHAKNQGTVAEEGYSLSFVPVLGAQARLTGNLWIGAGVAAPSTHLRGELTNTASSEGSSPDSNTGVYAIDKTKSVVARLENERPLRLNAGIAWDDRKSWSLAADVYYFRARQGAIAVDGVESVFHSETGAVMRSYNAPIHSSFDLVQIVNFSVGGEIVLTDNIALRAGAFTDNADTPVLDNPTLADQHALRFNRKGGTLGLGLTFGSFDSTLGVVYTSGSGTYVSSDFTSDQALSGGNALAVPVNASSQSVTFVISGAVTTEEAKKQIQQQLPVAGRSTQ